MSTSARTLQPKPELGSGDTRSATVPLPATATERLRPSATATAVSQVTQLQQSPLTELQIHALYELFDKEFRDAAWRDWSARDEEQLARINDYSKLQAEEEVKQESIGRSRQQASENKATEQSEAAELEAEEEEEEGETDSRQDDDESNCSNRSSDEESYFDYDEKDEPRPPRRSHAAAINELFVGKPVLSLLSHLEMMLNVLHPTLTTTRTVFVILERLQYLSPHQLSSEPMERVAIQHRGISLLVRGLNCASKFPNTLTSPLTMRTEFLTALGSLLPGAESYFTKQYDGLKALWRFMITYRNDHGSRILPIWEFLRIAIADSQTLETLVDCCYNQELTNKNDGHKQCEQCLSER